MLRQCIGEKGLRLYLKEVMAENSISERKNEGLTHLTKEVTPLSGQITFIRLLF